MLSWPLDALSIPLADLPTAALQTLAARSRRSKSAQLRPHQILDRIELRGRDLLATSQRALGRVDPYQLAIDILKFEALMGGSSG